MHTHSSNNKDGKIADAIRQAAENLSISRTRLYAEIKAGRIMALRAGGRTLISRAEQQRWLASLPIASNCGSRD